jgi:hypothetical protein
VALWITLGLVAGAVICAQARADGQSEETSMPEKTIEAVLRQHTGRLMSLPGVVGTAQGECAGRPCVKVFVVKKTAELARQIPSALEGYAVVIEQTGGIRARDPE